MDVKIQVKPMKKEDIPSYNGGVKKISSQFKSILEDFLASESECISLLSGDECEAGVTRRLAGHVRTCIKDNGWSEQLSVLERAKSYNIYVVKES